MRKLALILSTTCMLLEGLNKLITYNIIFFRADLMDNDTIETLLKYEPPWNKELVKWREKRKALLSSVASAAVPLQTVQVEPGQDIGKYSVM